MKESWHIMSFKKKIAVKNPILIAGLPGIGNVGKIVVDFLIDELKAKKLYEFYSIHFPNSVFVADNNLVELPSIEIYYKKIGKYDLFFLAGDVQPISAESCHEFCHIILDIFAQLKGKLVITLGGIGLQEVPDAPKVFCTGTSKKVVDEFIKGTTLNPNIYGVVGAFVGVAGVLVGLAGHRKIPAVSMLAETFAHPFYIGIKGSKEILAVLKQKLGLTIDINKLDKEIKGFEKDLIQIAEQMEEAKPTASKQSYIG